MKRFVIGFILGVGAMYWYLHNADIVATQGRHWFERSASEYRDDKQHKAAREVLGEGERR